ncbi:hypothetical protein BDN72DRAFT_793527 [Pluteus cervinus]|uniref:Uncharacterized protein n=1 Tax=Pluteus cervinus TaxID=181527 RepID=A0ACD3B190_9AGAR|nr:hypothetical protein BDN72DRAFT_793527 [Pluteus cervinus]
MEPFNRGFSDPRDEDDTHSMPGLESVSNSSDEEYEDVQEFVDESSSSDVDEHDETHPWRLAPNYNILGEIVDWQSLDQAESERSAPIRPPEEPQFVTDGRGRVVGSTSAAPASPRDKGTDEHGRTNQGSGLAGDDEGGN